MYPEIGALAKISQIDASPVIQERYTPLAQAARQLASAQVRNLATIGGNLCTAAPSAETASPLLALGAKVKLTSSKGERIIPLEAFFTGPGSTVLDKDVLTEVQIPTPTPRTRGVYKRIARRNALDLAIVSVTVVGSVSEGSQKWEEVKIALGAVAPTPMRALKAEVAINGKPISPEVIEKVAHLASEEARPISDIRGSAWYRKEMVKVLVRRSLEEISRR